MKITRSREVSFGWSWVMMMRLGRWTRLGAKTCRNDAK
jgi:hypothetical protein